MPNECHLRISKVIRQQRDELIRSVLDLGDPKIPKPANYQARDLEQMVDGFIALVTESLETERRETRSFFIETVIPSLIQSGTDPVVLVSGSVEFSIVMSVSVVNALDPADRAEAKTWFAGFFRDYVADMMRIALATKEAL